MNRDWSKAFSPASFKGEKFHVEVESASVGRRISVQYIAYGGHVSEDWGEKSRVFPSRIYVAGDIADYEMNVLLSVFDSEGPGLLKLPMQRPILAHLRNSDMRRDKRVNGYIPCDVEFVAVGSQSTDSGFSFNAGLAGFKDLGQNIAIGIGQKILGL